MASELKLCPFCAGSNLETYYADIEGWIAHIKCIDCDDMIGPMSEFKYETQEEAYEDASKRWNTRPTPVAPVSPDATGKCGELVTVGYQYKFGDVWLVSDAPKVMRKAGYELREVVTRENAEAVIVNVEAEKAKAIREAGKHFAKTCMMAEEIETLKAARSQAEELETVRIEKRLVSPYPQFWVSSYLPPDQPFDKHWTDPENGKQYEHRALVTRSQAVELLAAKDAEIKACHENINIKADFIEKTVGQLHEAEADNAALTARVKELDRCHEGTIDLCNQKTAQIEALEAKLAAAEKALKRIAARDGIPLAGSFAAEIARAYLEAKP